MKLMSEDRRKKIKLRIKNKQYIDDLIEGYSLRNENLDYARIKNFVRIGENLSNLKMRFAVIENSFDISASKGHNMNWFGSRVLCKGRAVTADMRKTDFRRCYFPYVDYSYADFREARFCDTVLTIGGTMSKGAKFSRKLYKDLIGLGRL